MAKRNSPHLSGSIILTVSVFAGCSGAENGVTPPPAAGASSVGTTATAGAATGQGGGETMSTGGATVGFAGSSAMGGTKAADGSQAATGGTVSTTGGSATTAATHATGGASSTGGSKATTGGSVATGGSRPTGGTASTGGTPVTGGTPATGATKATGGANPGGTQSTGGTHATGGASATGGSKAATGGASATGGSKAATGGSTSSSGLGTWTTGYVATMYGDHTSGDCAGYSNFSDTTNYNSQTCPNVTSKNATWYAALGDLSSLWVGGQCQCPGGSTGDCSQAPSCPSESASGGDCGICVAVKCDASGTFSLSGSTHDSDCNTSTYVVVQVIDACPHNHPTNVASSEGWCTSRQANHIDLSCSGLGGISTLGTSVGRDGWLNVDVQKVNCSSFTFGTHSL